MKFTFEFEGQEVDLILKGLQELPAKESLQLILKIDNLAKKQIEEKKEANNKK